MLHTKPVEKKNKEGKQNQKDDQNKQLEDNDSILTEKELESNKDQNDGANINNILQ